MSNLRTPPIIPKFTARPLPVRSEQIRAIVIHATGSANLDAVLRWYDDPSGLQPHYVIGWDGVVFQIVHEKTIAYHCAFKPAEHDAYANGFAYWSQLFWDSKEKNGPVQYTGGLWPGYARWLQRWRPDFESPLDFVTGRHPNQLSVGIELLSPTDDIKTLDLFTDAQYSALGEMIEDISARYQLPIDQHHVLGHQDICPLRRCTTKGGFDPGDAFNWSRVLED